MKFLFKTSPLKFLLATLLVASSNISVAAINVLACEPEWAALAKEIGQDHVSVNSATTALQDPHHIQARPSLISKARRADLLICSGAELEVGWLPVLLQKSGNPKIQSQSPGYLMTTDHVELLGKVENVSRSMGDIHGAGNPHVHLDPQRMIIIADVVAERLSAIDPENSEDYQKNKASLQANINALLQTSGTKIQALRNKQWVVHHNNWLYLNEWLELEQVATLEPKPGVPPTTKHLAKLVSDLKAKPAQAIAYGSYQPKKAANWLGNKTGIPVMAMPYTISDWEKPNAIVSWYDLVINTLHDTLNPE